jgi:hypothetical protein
MDDVLVYAEFEPPHDQVVALLHHLDGLDGTPVSALLHHRPERTTPLMDEMTGARGLLPQAAVAEIDAERRWELAAARRRLSHLVGVLRAAGHPAHGELLSGPIPKVLIQEVRAREPERLFLVTSRHRLAHWARHDLERRLRAVTPAEVVAVLPTDHLHPS